jgi:hypothetical protein
VFERTPKFGIASRRDSWSSKVYQLKLDRIIYAEFAFGIYNVFTVSSAIGTGNWMVAVHAGIFAVGLFFVAFMSLGQALHLRKAIVDAAPVGD